MSKTFSFASLLGRKSVRAEEEDPNKKPDDIDGDDEDEAKRAEWARKAESDDDRKQDDDESDEDYEARMRAMDEEEEEEAAAAEDDDDNEGDDEVEKDEKAKAAVKRERMRCAKIVAYGIKHDCVRQAGALAFETRLKASAAISVLRASKLDASKTGNERTSLSQRMRGTRIPVISSDGGTISTSQGTTSQAMIAAANKARGQ